MNPVLSVVAFIILFAGATGYIVAIVLLLAFRRWMGHRGEGWPRILLNALLALVIFLGFLYFDNLLRQLDLNENRTVRLSLSFFEAAVLMVIPWALAVAVWRWWPKHSRARALRDILPRKRG